MNTAIWLIFVAVILAVCIFCIVILVASFLSPKLRTPEEIQRALREFQSKLNLEDVLVFCKINDALGAGEGFAQELQSRFFEVELGKITRRCVVAHEMFHVFRMKLRGRNFRPGLKEEFLAYLYELMGFVVGSSRKSF